MLRKGHASHDCYCICTCTCNGTSSGQVLRRLYMRIIMQPLATGICTCWSIAKSIIVIQICTDAFVLLMISQPGSTQRFSSVLQPHMVEACD